MSVMGAIKDPDEIRKEMMGEDESPEEQLEELADPRDAEEYTFDFRYVDKKGKVWKGKFTNKILNFKITSAVGAIKAQMAQGMPWVSLDPFDQDHNEKVAHLTMSLIKRPTWARKMGELIDRNLLEELYKEVTAHEAIFSGRATAEEVGPARGEDASGETEGVV